MNRKVALFAVAIALVTIAVPAAGFVFASINTVPHRMNPDFMGRRSPGMMNQGSPLPMRGGGYFPPNQQRPSTTGNVSIDANRAKTVVASSMSSLKVGTISALGTSWVVPVEDAKGVLTSIQVTKVSASTADQAKRVVETSLRNGWTAGDATLMGTTYNVPLLDSNNAVVGNVRVDGKTGEIIRRPSTTVTVTSDQAKSKVNDAIKEFKVGDAKDRGTAWSVSINYKDRVVMTILLGKLNTPTSADAVSAVQRSITNWKAGDPKQSQSSYNVPISDVNGNTVGSIRVDGRTGDIALGIPSMGR